MNPRPAPQASGRDSGEEWLFRDSDGRRVHVLNQTAREIYLLCDGSRSNEDIAGEIAARYTVDARTANADVEEMVELLVGLGILARS